MKDHTEALKVTFDPSIVSYTQLLKKFFDEHHPASPSEGCRPQYINAAWYKTDEQKAAIVAKVTALRAGRVEVNTRIAPFSRFYRAEEYHQKYYAKNRGY